ncbi:MAG TPA: hypothetical protein PKE55_02750 [Kiritimatiellia bacterium]|nr:hypothetical protein [Kiritimatiellia bacterium]
MRQSFERSAHLSVAATGPMDTPGYAARKQLLFNVMQACESGWVRYLRRRLSGDALVRGISAEAKGESVNLFVRRGESWQDAGVIGKVFLR